MGGCRAIGYKVHLTETCEADGRPNDQPPLITHVATSASPIADEDATDQIHESLQNKDLLPATHIVDTGYLDANLLLTSRQNYNVDLLGPLGLITGGKLVQKKALRQQIYMWIGRNSRLPVLKEKLVRVGLKSWISMARRRLRLSLLKKTVSSVLAGLSVTSVEHHCKAKNYYFQRASSASNITEGKGAPHRKREKTEEYKAEYARRAGIEGTISQGVRAYSLRRAKYVGLAKTHLQHVLFARAITSPVSTIGC